MGLSEEDVLPFLWEKSSPSPVRSVTCFMDFLALVSLA
jgi:hypothetical protein